MAHVICKGKLNMKPRRGYQVDWFTELATCIEAAKPDPKIITIIRNKDNKPTSIYFTCVPASLYWFLLKDDGRMEMCLPE